MDYKSCKIDDIIEYCQKHGEVQWLKDTCDITYPTTDKNGNPATRKITFIEVKNVFFDKFLPEQAPKRQPKKPSFHDRVKAL